MKLREIREVCIYTVRLVSALLLSQCTVFSLAHSLLSTHPVVELKAKRRCYFYIHGRGLGFLDAHQISW